MNNFIELTTSDDKKILLNIANMASIAPATESTTKVHGFSTYVVMANQLSENDYFSVKESYKEVVDKIKRCTGAMVIQ